MPCKTFFEQTNGEKAADKRPPFSHLILCSVCRAEVRWASKLAKRAANLPCLAPPDALRDRTLVLLANAPTPDAAPNTKGKFMLFPISPRWASGLAAAAVVSVSVVAGALWYAPAVSAKAVKSAIEATDTWHFTGWRLQNGKKTPWEVWGRRAPFFYREQIGDEILTDDGKSRIRVLPPSPLRRKGVVLKMASKAPAVSSDPKDKAAISGDARFLIGIGGEFWGRAETPVRDGNLLRLDSKETMLGLKTVDETASVWVSPKTHLPVRFAVRKDVRQETPHEYDPLVTLPLESSEATAELDAAYNVALPENIAAPPVPKGYGVADFTKTFPYPDLPDDNIATQGGITVEGNALTQDDEGNLKLGFKNFVGDRPYRYADMQFHFEIQGRQGLAGVSAEDDLGNKYMQISLPGGMGDDSEHQELYFVPLEPLKPNAPRPHSLKLDLFVSIGTLEPVVEMRMNRQVDLNNAAMTITIPLPTKSAPLDYDTRPNSYGVEFVGVKRSLYQEAAYHRANTYSTGGSTTVLYNQRTGKRTVIRDVTNPQRGQFWWEQAAQEAERQGDRDAADRYRKNAEAFR